MKKEIHPEYFAAKATCGGCGASFETGSTLKDIHVSVCSECHPFYTGKQRFLDSEGRIDKFKAKYAKFDKKAS
ncbi:UNVERIFIED_CONTAM: hypothetical protein GTU68_021000 [Idotea baltica]|nr:hypothetical protein [Idotea baltica]